MAILQSDLICLGITVDADICFQVSLEGSAHGVLLRGPYCSCAG